MAGAAAADKAERYAEVKRFLEDLGVALDESLLAGIIDYEAQSAELAARIITVKLAKDIVLAINEAVETGLIPDRWDRPDRVQEIVTTGLKDYDPRLDFQAGLRAAYGAGRYERARDAGMTHAIYRSMRDRRVRPAHAALDGVCLPLDESWWDIHWPPNDPRCRCKGVPVNRRGIDKLTNGGVRLTFEAPKEKMISYVNRVTKETKTLPESVAPGWDIHPRKQPQGLAEALQGKYKDFEAIAVARS